LLKFARDRRRWIHWLFEAHKRFGLQVLNYMVTSNHIHLLVEDQGRGEIAKGMQLVAGRVAQEYNHRKGRRGAFWEDRYHATAVDSELYLARCLTYIDLNMVRAGVVSHPYDWQDSGFHELHLMPKRYQITNMERLMELLGIAAMSELQKARSIWAAEAINAGIPGSEPAWSHSIAVGTDKFLEQVKLDLGYSASHRNHTNTGGISSLRETPPRYCVHFGPENERLRGN